MLINEVASKGPIRSLAGAELKAVYFAVALYTIPVSDSGKSGSLWNIPERESFWNLPRCLVGMKGHVVK